ncbi:MAG TPA: tetratricopeptide repeat protein [Bacteroidota bacterium]|nr:tetratricopeptide repeat protein [Bacteroidota bacterium]
MKTTSFITVVALALIYLMVTGFQCGSAESTSAKLYVKNKDWSAAELALVKEVENNPANAEAWQLLGHVRLQKGEKSLEDKNYAQVRTDFENMVYAYNKSLDAAPDFQQQIQTEKLYAWQKALNAGVELFNKSIKAPEAEAKSIRGHAVEMYDVAIHIIPDSLLPYKNASIALQADGLADRQLPYLQKARKISADPEITTLLIQLYMDRGDGMKAAGDNAGAAENYTLALGELQEARKASPGNTDLLNAMIDLYIKVERAPEAIPLMEEGLKNDPHNRDYHYNLGVLLMQSGKLPEAIGHFDAALEVDPKYDFALQNAGSANLKIADEMKRAAPRDESRTAVSKKEYVEYFKKAASYFERLTAVRPDDPNAWDFYGSACANAGLLKEAEAAIKKADELRKK